MDMFEPIIPIPCCPGALFGDCDENILEGGRQNLPSTADHCMPVKKPKPENA